MEGLMEKLRSESIQISPGPPERRLLKTDKQDIVTDRNIRRCTFGIRNPGKMMRTILLLGETGTGKSTLINVMTNYILGVEWQDSICYEIVHEEARCQTESQTTAVTVYEIFGQEDVRVPFSVRIIDTPGYGDTRGEETDMRIAENMCELFKCENGVHQIDAVCLVMKASQNRLTKPQRCIFDAILSLFGKDVKSNIVVLITFSEGGKPAALKAIDKAGVPCPRDEKNQPVHFRFNNVFEKDDDEETPDFFKQNWEKGEKSMGEFFNYLKTMETRSLVMTEEVLHERLKLECSVQSLQAQIVETEHLQTQLKQTQEAMEKHKKEIEENKDFEYEVDELYKEQVESDQPATCCDKCKFTCHYPCTFVSESKLQWCAVMKSSACTSCPGKCNYSEHIKEKKRWERKVRKVKHTFDNLKNNFEKATGEKATLERLEKMHQEDLEKLAADKRSLILESYNHVIRLHEIALRPESLSTLQHLDFLIERLNEIGKGEKSRKIKDLKKRAEELHQCDGGYQFLLAKFSSPFNWYYKSNNDQY